MVDKIENWQYSSYPDYIGLREGRLISMNLATELLGINKSNFQVETYQRIPDTIIERLEK